MATMPNSPDWSLACVHCNQRIHQQLVPFNSSSIIKSKSFLFVSFLSSTSRLLVSTTSSSCKSPILEDASSHSPPVAELELKLQDFQIPKTAKIEDSNVLICAMFKDPKNHQLGFEYYQKAKALPDFRPQNTTIKHLVRYLIRSKSWNSIWSLSEDFEKFCVFPDSSTCCKLISSCIKARKFKIVNKIIDVLKSGDNTEGIIVLAFETAMRGYNKLHMYSSTIVMYEDMKSAGILLDPVCYCQIMEAYMKTGNNDKVVALFQEFEKKVDWTPFLPQIYRILCESLGKSGRAFEALEFFRDMTKKGFPEDSSFYSSLIYSFANIKDVKMAEELMIEAEGKKMLKDQATFLKLILMYIEQGMLEKTLDVAAVMKRMNVNISDCIFCAIVNGYSKKRGLNQTIKVYEDLILEGCEPGQVTYASIINVYCKLGLHSKAEDVFSEMESKGIYKCVVAYASIIAMYGKTDRIRDAMRLVAKMKERGCAPNVWIYNSLLDMHGKIINLRQVEKIWKEMKRRKVLPDKVSYTSIINAYYKGKELEKCVEYYQEYRLNGGGIDKAMAAIMVGVFSKTNNINELVQLLQDLNAERIQLDGRLYRSSLNALRDAGMQDQAKWLLQSFEAR
ncbi:pentatricopeptide repeat-containing protein At5g13770, chloroplastic isoform X1 [Apium graveolens]|uniref:pentatricopeptide repeat-containing protein At5g13770, chloroplastic isoform X1 n=2 Tax=Apium graveolens TaxID=4045 RepID=UPI003D78EFC4